MEMPLGDVRGKYLTEQLQVIQRLSEDFDQPEWQHLSLELEGEPKDALVYRQGSAWAAVIDLDDNLAVGMRGVGIEPDEYELVVIEDLTRYPSQLSGADFAEASGNDEPVTLAEVEKGLVIALAGVSRIADILSDVLKHQEDSGKYIHALGQLEILGVLVDSYAARLADHYGVTLEWPFVRDSRDSEALEESRLAAGLSLDDLAEASGVDIDRLRNAEGNEATVDLTDGEWVRLAVVFEGHSLADFIERQGARGQMKWLTQRGKMLESARRLVQFYFGPGSEDT